MIELSDKTKLLILVAIIAVVIFFFVQNRLTGNDEEATHNEGALTVESEKQPKQIAAPKNIDEESLEEVVKSVMAEETPKQKVSISEESESDASVLRKFRTRNNSRDGSFVSSSYSEGKRGGRASDLDKFFEEGHPLDEKVGFQKNDTQAKDIQFANYIPGKQRKMREVDKFNAEALLPKEKHKDWFDDPYESTSVKNTHLINIYRPIGVNTISTTLKNANRQLRAEFSNPKFATSPWMNSSYEPDTNIRAGAMCI